MSSLTAIFGNSEEKTQDSDKLMDLYWNRAELKKEFADMRKEQYRLRDLVKEQEGRTARIQQQLDHLEGLLVDPDWAHNVVVYYQLRGLGRRAGTQAGSICGTAQTTTRKERRIARCWSIGMSNEKRTFVNAKDEYSKRSIRSSNWKTSYSESNAG